MRSDKELADVLLALSCRYSWTIPESAILAEAATRIRGVSDAEETELKVWKTSDGLFLSKEAAEAAKHWDS